MESHSLLNGECIDPKTFCAIDQQTINRLIILIALRDSVPSWLNWKIPFSLNLLNEIKRKILFLRRILFRIIWIFIKVTETLSLSCRHHNDSSPQMLSLFSPGIPSTGIQNLQIRTFNWSIRKMKKSAELSSASANIRQKQSISRPPGKNPKTTQTLAQPPTKTPRRTWANFANRRNGEGKRKAIS